MKIEFTERELELIMRALDKKIWALDHVGMSRRNPLQVEFRALRDKVREGGS